jgi:hypothetical protein
MVRRWYRFDLIVGYKRGEGGYGNAIGDKVGCWKSSGMRVTPPGKRYRRKGWLLEILWYEGDTTWETLTAMQPRCAEYAILHGLTNEPTFKCWVRLAIVK